MACTASISFQDDDLLVGTAEHNRPLYATGTCSGRSTGSLSTHQLDVTKEAEVWMSVIGILVQPITVHTQIVVSLRDKVFNIGPRLQFWFQLSP